jgi:tetratricopeptide (TPR) repeat protein
MTAIRLAWTFVLLLPIGCSGAHVNPGLPPAEKGEDDNGPDALDPRDADDYVRRGDAYAERGEYQKAVADYKEAVRLAPDNDEACGSLAWLLATCPEDRVRDGKRAVELATKACELSGWEDADFLRTLAAAQAECRNFEEAVRWQKEALKIGFEDEDEVETARRQLKLYQERKPYREER